MKPVYPTEHVEVSPDHPLSPIERRRDHRRLRILHLNEQCLIAVLQGKCQVAEIPEGATIDRCFYDQNRMGFGVVMKHPSFDEVPDGAPIPHFGMILLQVANERKSVVVASYTEDQIEQIRRFWNSPDEPQQIAQEPYVGLDGSIN